MSRWKDLFCIFLCTSAYQASMNASYGVNMCLCVSQASTMKEFSEFQAHRGR